MKKLIEAPCYLDPETVIEAYRALQNAQAGSETAKHRHIAAQYIKPGMNGVDCGSSGDPVVPWAIQVELPLDEYRAYNTVRPADQSIHWRGSALDLPFFAGTLDFVHSAHLLEDFEDWGPALKEWHRVLKPNGYLLIAVPDHKRFRAHVKRHKDEHGLDVDNLSHKSEHLVRRGAIKEWFLDNMASQKYETVYDDFVNDDPCEYSLLWVARRLF